MERPAVIRRALSLDSEGLEGGGFGGRFISISVSILLAFC